MSADSATDEITPASTAPAWRRVGLGVLSASLPAGLIDEAVAATGVGQRRVRLLPARVVVLFVLACSLFGTDGYRQVWRQLVSGWPALARITPTRSAFTQARRRVGEAPLAYLFERVRGVQGAPGMPGVFLAGRRLVAWDGTKLHLADTEVNDAAFGRDRGGGTVAGYPRLWLLTLIECGTHAVIAAAFNGRDGEHTLARRLIGDLRPDMLLIVDRNFFGYQLWAAAAGTGAGLLWRVKLDRQLPVVRALPDGSWLSVLKPPAHRRGQPAIPVRVCEYTVTVTSTSPAGVSTRTERFRLVTNLLDADLLPAGQLADCYRQRWEAETGYQNLKTRQRGPKVVLRSRDPAGVRQETWAYLLTYQALRALISHTAAEHRLDTDQLSFLTCLRAARRHIINRAVHTRRDLTDALRRLADDLLDDQLDPRRPRSSPRAVKRPTSPYRSKKRTEPASTTTTYKITVTGPDQPTP